MSKKKRQTVTLLLLCLLLIAAGAGYVLLLRHQAAQEKAEEAEEEGTALFSLSSDDITQMEYQSEKASLTLVKDGDDWTLKKDTDFPLDQDKITDMADEMAGVSATRTVTEKCDDLSEYNLDQPELTVQVKDSSGGENTLYVGMESISGGGRYAYCGNDTGKVYIISTSLYSSFDYSQNDLMTLPEIPGVKAANVTYLKIEAKKGKNFEAVYDKKNSPYKDIYGWSIEQPYSQAVAGDKDQLQNLFGSYTDLTLSSGLNYKNDAAQEAKCGLDDPAYVLTLRTAKKSIRLTFGAKDDAKENYYVKVGGRKGIYMMDVSTVDSLVSVDPLDYVYQRLYVGEQEKLQQVALSYKSSDYVFDVTRSKKKNDDGEYTYTVKKDGKKVDADDFTTAYSAVSYLAPNAEIDSNVKVISDKPTATFTFREKKKKVKMTIYPYDGKNFYRIEVDGVMQFLVDINTVDKILDEFTALK